MIPNHSVIVSAIEPQGKNRKKVWFRKGKNLFNKDNVTVTVGWIDNNGNITYDGNSTIIENYVKIPNNKNITIYAKGLQLISLYNKNKEFIKNLTTRGVEEYTFKDANTYFIKFQMNTSKYDLNSVQIEEGLSAKPYEAYIEPQIYVRNSNGMYEEFIEKKIKYGSVKNPDSSKFQITYSRIVQVDNTVYVDIIIKILTEIPANTQYNFNISGVTPPESAIYPLASYGVNEFNLKTSIYNYVGKGNCVLNNVAMNSAANGFWKVHFSYNVD